MNQATSARVVPEIPTTSSRPQGDDRSQMAAALIAFQGAMYTVTAVEAAGVAAITGNAAGSGPVVLSLLLAVGLFCLGIRVRKVRAFRTMRFLEGALLAWAGIDLALAILLSDTGLGLLATITRIGIPIAIFALTSRFGAHS